MPSRMTAPGAAASARTERVRNEIMNGDKVSLAEVASQFQGGGLRTIVRHTTVWRWCVEGLSRPGGRLYLEHCYDDKSDIFTSRAAVARFLARRNGEYVADA